MNIIYNNIEYKTKEEINKMSSYNQKFLACKCGKKPEPRWVESTLSVHEGKGLFYPITPYKGPNGEELCCKCAKCIKCGKERWNSKTEKTSDNPSGVWEVPYCVDCSYECLSRPEEENWKYEKLLKKWQKEDKVKDLDEWKQTKLREIQFMDNWLRRRNAKIEDLEPNNRNYRQEISNVGEEWSEENFQKILDIRERVEQDKDICKKERKNKRTKCDKCQGKIGENGCGSVDNHGNYRSFCSKNCLDTFSESWTSKSIVVIKRNVFVEILKWMKKQGIESIRFDQTSGQLLVEYSGKIEKPVEEKDLTPELKEIKDYYQENSENTKPLSRELIQQEINKSGVEPKNEGNGMLIFGLLAAGVIIVVLIGVIFHKKRIRKY